MVWNLGNRLHSKMTTNLAKYPLTFSSSSTVIEDVKSINNTILEDNQMLVYSIYPGKG